MTRVLILGGAGMLGHQLWLRLRDRFDTRVTLRGAFASYESFNLFDRARTIDGVDADDFDSVRRAVDAAKPDVVVNAIGIVKQLAAAKDPIPSIAVNALFPHRVAALGVRMIHISTDCVFSGRAGMRKEGDPEDAEDLYGRSKLLGEVVEPPHVTLRTSIIGRELRGGHGLVDWFLGNAGGRVRGFTTAIFSGLTTPLFADVIGDVIERPLAGLYHVSAEPIAKYDLLVLLREVFGIDVEIEPRDDVRIDRSLDSTRFRAAMEWEPPSWPEMVRLLSAEC